MKIRQQKRKTYAYSCFGHKHVINCINSKSEMCLFTCKKHQIWTMTLVFLEHFQMIQQFRFPGKTFYSWRQRNIAAYRSSLPSGSHPIRSQNHSALKAERILLSTLTEWYEPVFSMESASATDFSYCCFVSTVNLFFFFFVVVFSSIRAVKFMRILFTTPQPLSIILNQKKPNRNKE